MTCESGTVHLVGGDSISRGRVEYCYDGSWYSVCASDLDEEEAQVICNTLGYYTTNNGKVDHNTCIVLTVNFCTANITHAFKHMKSFHHLISVVYNFGHGMSPILPKSIHCTREDSILSDCSTTDQDISQCQHVAGVICGGL